MASTAGRATAFAAVATALILFATGLPGQNRGQEAEIDVRDYTINAEVDPVEQTLRATVTVDFVPTEDASTLTFGLNNALELHSVVDGQGRPVSGQRLGTEMAVRLLPVESFPAGQPASLTFSYAGQLTGDEESPVWGLKFASIQEDFAYFMYPSRWFPVSGYTTDRFAMDLRVTVPEGYHVIGSGEESIVEPGTLTATGPAPQATSTFSTGATFSSESTFSTGAIASDSSARISEDLGERPRLVRRDGADGEPQEEEPQADVTIRTSVDAPAEPEDLAPTISIETTAGPEFQAPDIQTEVAAAPVIVDDGRVTTRFQFDRYSFPGSFAISRDAPQQFTANGIGTKFYVREGRDMAGAYASELGNAVEYLSGVFGPLLSTELTIVETEDGSRNFSAPGILFLAPAALTSSQVDTRVLVNQLARQWWGARVSPTTRNHMWLENGMARYAEILYTEDTQGKGAAREQIHDAYVEALTVEQPPMIQAARLEDYSPEYFAITAGKGAAVLNMLRVTMGDEQFFQLLKQAPNQFSYNSLDSIDFQDMAEDIYGDSLNGFFLQWIESSGAPEFALEYTVFRTSQGFRINGKITQDLDLFRMPVKLRIDTEGNPEEKSVIVSGTSSEFAIETFGKPVDVVLDPDGDVLSYNDDMRVSVAIRRGEQFAQVSQFLEAINEYERALQVKRNSSLAQFRVGEVYLLQGNLQEAANRYREALSGDLDPAWTEVWAHIKLGNIFDITDSRDRAVNEYRQALRTRDNTANALEEAEKYLNEPYQRERTRY